MSKAKGKEAVSAVPDQSWRDQRNDDRTIWGISEGKMCRGENLMGNGHIKPNATASSGCQSQRTAPVDSNRSQQSDDYSPLHKEYSVVGKMAMGHSLPPQRAKAEGGSL